MAALAPILCRPFSLGSCPQSSSEPAPSNPRPRHARRSLHARRFAACMQFYSPLRYPGGKGRLAQFLCDLIEANGLSGGTYVEPYAGGAAVALALLNLEYASKIHINDINRSVHAFWRAVLDHPDELCRRIHDTAITIDEWRRQRGVQAATAPELVDLAYSTFFLNRANRSGILFGGVIGGQAQDSAWTLAARFNKGDLIERIERISELRSRITLTNMDALALLTTLAPRMPRRSLIYLDPPYYVKGKGLYEDHYAHEDHARVAAEVLKLGRPWIVSYDNVPEIRAMYSPSRCRTFGLRYSAQTRYEGGEVVFFSDSLKSIPDEVVPSRAAAA